MNLSTHRISDQAFSRLAAGGGGRSAVLELSAAQRSKHRLLIRALVEEARAARHPHAGLAAQAYGLLSEIEERAPKDVDRFLCHPAVGAWALRTCRSLLSGQDGSGEDPGRLAALAVGVAASLGVDCHTSIPAHEGTIILPGLGRVALPGGVHGLVDATVRSSGGSVRLDVGGSTVWMDSASDAGLWHAIHRVHIADEFSPLIDDLDPYRWPQEDVAPSPLTGSQLKSWESHLADAWRILTAEHWSVAEEAAAIISVLTPITSSSTTQRSASSRELFGTIALSDPLDGLTLAATLAHELQHAKLHALTDVVRLSLPDDGRRYYAPWRPDPRPVNGLIHGAYAFLGVAGFWRRQHHRQRGESAFRAQVEFARWREAAYLVTETLLGSAGLTDAGKAFVGETHRTLEAWQAEPVEPAAAAAARRESEAHLDAWTRRNGATAAPGRPDRRR
ncbi:HEXXH motif domain-containing protein [Planotetraspora thailandica]|uniref:HEXXH motif domain-containing protein n=1 Tax=Planotetraspora thailandica TaxID=487172 RepID=A0A8J3XX19_9ACTN|nr:HEXXH motif domain-containing protein [Planotetraspora thailandica]GII52398.1 HEXXH motif domain-containing protein [Planotetraspora thailandica]